MQLKLVHLDLLPLFVDKIPLVFSVHLNKKIQTQLTHTNTTCNYLYNWNYSSSKLCIKQNVINYCNCLVCNCAFNNGSMN